MTQRYSAQEFYQHIKANEKNPGFMDELATRLDAPVSRLRAAYVACKVHDGRNVHALGSLYSLWLDQPGDRPNMEELLDEEGRDRIPLRQKAFLNQLGKRYDPDVTPEDCIEDLIRLQAADPTRFITETAYMAEGGIHIDSIRRHFGSFLEFRRQAGLQLDRNQHKLQRDVAKHVSLDVYRRFYTQEVMPYANLYELADKRNGRIKTMVVGSDFHDIDADRFVLDVFIETCRDMQPDYILLNGDVFDEYEFSRYDIDPRGVAIKDRFDFVKQEIFARLRAACPNAQIDFVIGNHDWRILKILAERTPAMKVILHDVVGLTLADVFGVHDYAINLVSKWDLDFAAFNKTDIKSNLRKNYKVYTTQNGDPMYVAAHIKDYGFGVSGTSGHIHKPEYHPFTNIHGKHSWMVTPSIAKVDADYVEGLDKAQNGFGIVHMDTKTGEVQQELIKVGNFVHIHGRYFYRDQK